MEWIRLSRLECKVEWGSFGSLIDDVDDKHRTRNQRGWWIDFSTSFPRLTAARMRSVADGDDDAGAHATRLACPTDFGNPMSGSIH